MTRVNQEKVKTAIAKYYGVHRNTVEFYDWKTTDQTMLFVDFNITIKSIKLRGHCYVPLQNRPFTPSSYSDLAMRAV